MCEKYRTLSLGFANRKPKHRQNNGSYPLSLLRFAVQQICKMALVEVRKLEQAFQAKMKQRQKTVFAPTVQTSPQAAYFAHYENIRAHITVEDFSRVDAMIALRMRANGHSPEAVLVAIRDCAPQIRTGTEKRRNWQSYAERTANYAFGYAGDRDLQRNANYIELWQKIELRQDSVHANAEARLR